MSLTFRLFLTAATAAALLATVPVSAQAQGATKPAKTPPKNKKAKPKPIPGGANQVKGMNGKVGDMLFDGRWRFQVREVLPVNTYTLTVPSSQQDYGRFRDFASEDLATHTFTPAAGYTFIAVKCLVKNGQNKMQQLDCYPPDLKTALADDQGSSHPPIVYDMQSKGAWTAKPLLPGAAQPMTVLFAVPTNTRLKDLVFSLKNWSDAKVTNLRIALPPTLGTPPPPTAPAPAT